MNLNLSIRKKIEKREKLLIVILSVFMAFIFGTVLLLQPIINFIHLAQNISSSSSIENNELFQKTVTIVLSLVVWYTTLMLFVVGITTYKNGRDFKDFVELHLKILENNLDNIKKDMKEKMEADLKLIQEDVDQNIVLKTKEYHSVPPQLILNYLKKEHRSAQEIFIKFCEIDYDNKELLKQVLSKMTKLEEKRCREIEHDLKVMMINMGGIREIESGLKYLIENGKVSDIKLVEYAKIKFPNGNDTDNLIKLADMAVREIERKNITDNN